MGLLLLAGLIAGCGGSSSGSGTTSLAKGTTPNAGTPQKGGSLTVDIPDPIDGWDPSVATQLSSYQILKEVMEPLVRVSADGQSIVPALAKSWHYNAARTALTFQLQPNATFSNGQPVTAKDVVFSAKQWEAGPLYAKLYAMLGKPTAQGAHTVVFHLPFPSSMVLPMLSWANAAIVPAGFDGKSAKAFYQRPVGAGPFEIASQVAGRSIVLARNPHYYDNSLPHLDKLTYNVVADNNQRLLQLQSGQAGIIDRVPLDLIPRLPHNATAVDRPATAMSLIVFNQAKAPTNAVGFRRAVSLAIDRSALAKSIYDGHAEVADSVLPPHIPGSNGCPGCNWDKQNVAAAKSALKGSSYSGATIPLLVDSSRAIDLLAAQAIQPMLAAAGIKIQVQQVDSATFLNRLETGAYTMAIGNYSAISPTPNDPLSFILATKFLFTGASTKPALAAFEAVLGSSDPAAQAKAVAGFEKAAYEQVPVAPLVVPDIVSAVASNVHGLGLTPGGIYDAADLWVSR